MRLMPPPYPPARDETTEPGLGALALRQENARLLGENTRLRSERNEARQERDELRASDALPSVPPPLPGQRRRKAVALGTAAGIGGGLLLAARLVLRAVADQWPEYAPIAEGFLVLLGGP
jgi:hypothetical protein